MMDQILTIRLYAAGIGIVVGEFECVKEIL